MAAAHGVKMCVSVGLLACLLAQGSAEHDSMTASGEGDDTCKPGEECPDESGLLQSKVELHNARVNAADDEGLINPGSPPVRFVMNRNSLFPCTGKAYYGRRKYDFTTSLADAPAGARDQVTWNDFVDYMYPDDGNNSETATSVHTTFISMPVSKLVVSSTSHKPYRCKPEAFGLSTDPMANLGEPGATGTAAQKTGCWCQPAQNDGTFVDMFGPISLMYQRCNSANSNVGIVDDSLECAEKAEAAGVDYFDYNPVTRRCQPVAATRCTSFKAVSKPWRVYARETLMRQSPSILSFGGEY